MEKQTCFDKAEHWVFSGEGVKLQALHPAWNLKRMMFHIRHCHDIIGHVRNSIVFERLLVWHVPIKKSELKIVYFSALDWAFHVQVLGSIEKLCLGLRCRVHCGMSLKKKSSWMAAVVCCCCCCCLFCISCCPSWLSLSSWSCTLWTWWSYKNMLIHDVYVNLTF